MMRNRQYPQWLIFSLLLLSLASCQEVVELDLETTTPQLVVEANVTDEAGPYTVKLSKTGAYFGSASYEKVSGATVTLSDNEGQQETLVETGKGTYQTSSLQGVQGRTYTLSILAEGKEYTAQSTLPYRVTLDSLGQEYEESGIMEDEDENTKGYHMKAYFQDPVGIKNYYRVDLYLNGVRKDEQIYLQDDDLSDGKKITYSLFRHYAQLGQEARIELVSIDKATYDYYNTLSNIIGDGGGFASSIPDNPKNNLSNGAQGYFAASTASIKAKVIQ